MNAVNDWQTWVSIAEEDYKLTVSSLRRRQPLAYGACFHAQQCAEKYLKAILVERGRTFPKIHDLSKLSVLCEQAGVIVPISEDQLETLSTMLHEHATPATCQHLTKRARRWQRPKTCDALRASSWISSNRAYEELP